MSALQFDSAKNTTGSSFGSQSCGQCFRRRGRYRWFIVGRYQGYLCTSCKTAVTKMWEGALS